MAKLNFVKSARKDNLEHGIKKGDSYYWWSFRSGSFFVKRFSKERPRRSQLTQSDFYAELWDIEDDISEIIPSEIEDVESVIEELKDRIQNLRDETEEKLYNMPEGLQQGPTGELLQERVDSLDNWISELDSIDFEGSIEEIVEELQGLTGQI